MSTFLRSLDISLSGRDTDPRFAAAWQTTRAAAHASLKSIIKGHDVSDRLSGWGHNYFCPEHSGPLQFDETRPDRHRCAEFDHEVTGEQFDSGWATVRNDRLMEHLSASAVASAVTGAAEHTDRAIGILTGIAGSYPDLPLHGKNVGQGRLTAQSLEEAMAAVSLTRSYELVAHAMNDHEQQLIIDRLFRPMVEVIQCQLMERTHNIEVWHLAGLASLAVVLDDRDLATTTLHKENGFRGQLTEGLLGDGWWFEGSPGYHFYMLTAVLAAVESYRALGLEEGSAESLETMLITPVETARNDLTVPAFNDCSLVTAVPPGLASHADLYFRGARLCASGRLDLFLGSGLAGDFDRTTPTYLLYGAPSAAVPAPDVSGWPMQRRDVLRDSGYAVLRQPHAQQGAGPDTCVFVKFGPHGGGHGKPDKLEIDLMINGSRVIADPGSPVYTNPIHHSWYVQTWSHSTVLIDRISQPPSTGRILGHRPVAPDAFGWVAAEVCFDAGGGDEDDPARVAAYAGVTMRRILAMVPPEQGDYLLDLVVVDAPHPRTIDLITHVRGNHASPAGRPAPDRLLLPQFDQVRRSDHPHGRTDYLLTDEQRPWSRWHTGGDELLTAVTPTNPTHELCATTVERVVGISAVFVSALPLGATDLGELRINAGAVELEAGGVPHRWDLDEAVVAAGPTTAWVVDPPLTLHQG